MLTFLWRSLPSAIPLAAVIAAGALSVAWNSTPASSQDASGSPAVYGDVNRALESKRIGDPYRWTDRARRQSGTIIVRRTFYSGSQPCRDYTRTTEVGGKLVSTTKGTGCRIGDGIWSLTEQPPVMAAPKPSPARARSPAATPSPSSERRASESEGRATAGSAFVAPPPPRKPVLIFASRPAHSEW